MNYAERIRRLAAIRDALANRQAVESLTVREFISWFNAERRGYKVTYRIRRYLKDHGLRTLPDFEGVHIDARITFTLTEPEPAAVAPPPAIEAPAAAPADQPAAATEPSEPAALVAGAASEPAFRVSRLLAASTKPLGVPPDCTLCEAVTLMLRHDYSQLPVMTNDRDVKGVISWESIAPRLALSADSLSLFATT